MEQVQRAVELAQEGARVEEAARGAWADRAQARAATVFARAVALKYHTRLEIHVTISAAQNAAQKWCVSKKWPDPK